MSAGAIIMMCIGCGALWGGFAISSTIGIRHLIKERKAHLGEPVDKK